MIIGTGTFACVSGISSTLTWLWVLGAVLALLGFASMRGYRFASWGYLILGLGLMLTCAWHIHSRGYSWQRVAVGSGSLACVGLALFDVTRCGKVRRRREDTLVSLVMLQRIPRFLDDQVLGSIASSAWDSPFFPQDRSASPSVTSEGCSLRVNSEQGFFAVRSVDHPFWKQPQEAAVRLNDVRAQRAMREHLGWISVGLVGVPKTDERAQAYTKIARLLAELADANTLAILKPDTGSFRVWDNSVSEILRSDTPLDCFSISNSAPVVQVCSDDPLLVTAVQEARRRWPEFTRVFSTRHPEQHFSVKAPITRGSQTEHIWVDVTAITTDYVRGKLGNAPIDLPGLELGDPVSVPISTIEDWLYVLTDEPIGGFTIPVVTLASERARHA